MPTCLTPVGPTKRIDVAWGENTAFFRDVSKGGCRCLESFTPDYRGVVGSLCGVRWLILCFPLPLLAQLPLDPWSTWDSPSPTWQVFAEQSGPKPGWHALGAQWIRPQWAFHGLVGPTGAPSCLLFSRVALSPQHPLLFGWGLEYGRASLYGQGTFALPGGRSSRIRAHWSPGRRLEAMASLTQWTEWGWYVSFAGLASTTQGIEFVVHARPAQHPHFRGIYASTSGRWRAEWAGDHWSVLFGAGPYGYSRWALHPHNPGW